MPVPGEMASSHVASDAGGEGHLLKCLVRVPMPLDQAESTQLLAFRPDDGGLESLALIVGSPSFHGEIPVIVHFQNVAGDLVASLEPGLGPLRQAVARLAALGGGVLLYLAVNGDKAAGIVSAILRHLSIAQPKFLAPLEPGRVSPIGTRKHE